jgi:hypothetical protein
MVQHNNYLQHGSVREAARSAVNPVLAALVAGEEPEEAPVAVVDEPAPVRQEEEDVMAPPPQLSAGDSISDSISISSIIIISPSAEPALDLEPVLEQEQRHEDHVPSAVSEAGSVVVAAIEIEEELITTPAPGLIMAAAQDEGEASGTAGRVAVTECLNGIVDVVVNTASAAGAPVDVIEFRAADGAGVLNNNTPVVVAGTRAQVQVLPMQPLDVEVELVVELEVEGEPEIPFVEQQERGLAVLEGSLSAVGALSPIAPTFSSRASATPMAAVVLQEEEEEVQQQEALNPIFALDPTPTTALVVVQQGQQQQQEQQARSSRVSFPLLDYTGPLALPAGVDPASHEAIWYELSLAHVEKALMALLLSPALLDLATSFIRSTRYWDPSAPCPPGSVSPEVARLLAGQTNVVTLFSDRQRIEAESELWGKRLERHLSKYPGGAWDAPIQDQSKWAVCVAEILRCRVVIKAMTARMEEIAADMRVRRGSWAEVVVCSCVSNYATCPSTPRPSFLHRTGLNTPLHLYSNPDPSRAAPTPTSSRRGSCARAWRRPAPSTSASATRAANSRTATSTCAAGGSRCPPRRRWRRPWP